MRSKPLQLGFLFSGALLVAACSGGGGDGEGGSPVDPCSALEPIANADYCAAQSSDPNCDLVTKESKYNACGIALKEPPGALSRSSTVEEYGGTGDPDLGCFEPSGYPEKPGTPQTVTMKGLAVIFSHGCQSSDLTIEVHKVKRTGGADDGEMGDLIGSAVTTPSDCTVAGVASEEDNCDPSRYECTYEYPGVPTETELVVKTSGSKWTALYDYNIFIRNSDVTAGAWEHDVRALATDDYGLISQTAIGAPITSGHGAIAGEVHDCGDVRLINALVDVNVPRKVLTYFGDDEQHPLPDLGGKATSSLALYSAIDVNPGQASISAAGIGKDGSMRGLGFLRVHVYPDSVTTVTFRGMNPVLVP
ncbi:MAG: hypothetical protein IPK82_31830 [Polyangiaceae bacterium]|nr:hypothetical protein [Polyangiaceae bacterium]